MHASPSPTPLDATVEIIWDTLLAAANHTRQESRQVAGCYALDPTGRLRRVPDSAPEGLLIWQPDSGWAVSSRVSNLSRDLLDLYLPLCHARPDSPITVGHLGQSLDGYIATHDGDSFYVTGPENIRHLHRMRALCDAVVVGAETVAADNPRLTTRLVAGASPTRVVLDPQGRLSSKHVVFTDTSTPTLVVRDREKRADSRPRFGNAEIVEIPVHNGELELELDLGTLLSVLRQRGMFAVFVEGGGKTVSHFLRHGLLNHLQVAVAPLVIGSGRPGVRLNGDSRLGDCLRPLTRLYRMGGDMLFDLDLRQPAITRPDVDDDLERVL